MSVVVDIYGGSGPWVFGPDAAEPIPLDDVLLAREVRGGR